MWIINLRGSPQMCAASWQPAEALVWLLDPAEPWSRWLALTALLDRSPDDREVIEAHAAVLADPRTVELIDRLPDWEAGTAFSGHDSPSFAPNLLGLLADMGVQPRDSARVDALVEAMLSHRNEADRFATYAPGRNRELPAWGALLCDDHAITDVLIRFGRAGEPPVVRSIARMLAGLATTPQGTAWTCIPSLGFRGPGRKGDVCPQVTVEALRAIARRPGPHPSAALDAARTLLGVWRERATRQPYMFGHGHRFKTVKWPAFWYSSLAVLDAVGRYRELWDGPDAREEDRRSVAELAACLVAYNLDTEGRVTPSSCYRGFERFSFGQKLLPSPFATALLLTVLRRVGDLSDEVDAVDILALESSKGGTGSPRPPNHRARPGGTVGASAALRLNSTPAVGSDPSGGVSLAAITPAVEREAPPR